MKSEIHNNSNNKKISRLVIESYSHLKKKIISNEIGIPVVATITNDNNNKNEFLLSKCNIKTISKKHEPTSHAEFLLLNEMIEKNVKGDFLLFINILPCKECYEKIIECEKNGIYIKEIFYINNYKKIKKINSYKFFNKKIKLTTLSSSSLKENDEKKLKYISGIFDSYISYMYIVRKIDDWLFGVPEEDFFIKIPSKKYSNNYDYLTIINKEVQAPFFKYDDYNKCFIVNAIFLKVFWFLNKDINWKDYETNDFYKNFDHELINYIKRFIKNIKGGENE